METTVVEIYASVEVVEIISPVVQVVEVERPDGADIEAGSTAIEIITPAAYTVEVVDSNDTIVNTSSYEVVLYGGAKGDQGDGIPKAGGVDGDLLTKTGDESEWLTPEAIKTFLVSDWVGPFAGNYEMPFQHNLGDLTVTVEATSGGNVFVTDRRIDSANLVTLIVPASPDLRFEGSIRITRN